MLAVYGTTNTSRIYDLFFNLLRMIYNVENKTHFVKFIMVIDINDTT